MVAIKSARDLKLMREACVISARALQLGGQMVEAAIALARESGIKAIRLTAMSKRLSGESAGYITLLFYNREGNVVPLTDKKQVAVEVTV
jgi:Xaa-Pro aminopeptidase